MLFLAAFLSTALTARAQEATAEGEAPLATVPPRFLAPLLLNWPADVDPARPPATVELDLLVDERGVVVSAVVIRGEPPFGDLAVAASFAATLTAAMEDGVAVAVHVPLTVTFTPPPVCLEGTLRLAGGGAAALAGVTVRAGGQSTTTDLEGRFVFRGIAPGPLRLEADVPGVRLDPVETTLAEGEVVSVTLWAQPTGLDPGIVGTYSRGRAEIARRSLDAAELRAMPGSLGDPLRAVVNLPGTTRSPLETGWLLVRGGEPRDTAVYVDGVRVPLVYHLGGYTSVLHPAFIERVDFLPGGGGARYGRSLAGTVDVVTRRPAAKPEVRVGANLVFAGVYGSTPLGKSGAFAASARRSYLDAVLAPLLPGGAADSIPRFWDWQARADFGPDQGAYGFGYADSLALAAEDGASATLELATERLHYTRRGEIAGRPYRATPFLAWEHLRFDVDDWSQVSRREHWGGGLRAELEDDGLGPVGGSAGVDAEVFYATIRSNELQRGEPVAMPDAYGDLRIGQDTQLVVGLRLDTMLVGDQPTRLGLSPRVSVRHPLGPRAALEAEAGVRHEPPPWELVLGPPEGATLELDESFGGSVTGEWGAGPVDLTGDLYARYSSRLTGIEEDGTVDQGEGLAFGAEVSAKVTVARFTGLGRVALSSSQRREDNDVAWLPSPYDQPVTIGLVGSYDLGRFWTASGRFRYASGFYVGSDRLSVVDALTLENVGVDPVRNRVEDYHTLDVKLAKRFVFRTWRLDAWLDVQNVYNHRVPEPVVTGFSDVVFDGLGFGFMTLPIFGVEGQWGGDARRP